MTPEQVAKAREMLRKREPFGRIYAATSISSEQLFALLYGLRDMSDADAAEYWQRNLASLTTCEALHQHFKARAYPSVEANQFEQIAALVVRLRNELEHTNQHLVAHIDALTKSNAQCGEYLRRNEQLHSELVDVRAALAATTEQRDSLKRTLDEWSNAETKPHARVAADDIADHVVPPVLPMCTTCHGCGGPIIYGTVVGSPSVLHCRNEHCLRRVWAWRDDISPYHGPCKSSTPVRHE